MSRDSGQLGEMTDDEWRQLFIKLNIETHVRDTAKPETWPDDWNQEKRFSIAAANNTDIEITFGLPLEAEPLKNIVCKAPSFFTTPSQTKNTMRWNNARFERENRG